jgi:D-sedoheptulose 7-phosphate isomerase
MSAQNPTEEIDQIRRELAESIAVKSRFSDQLCAAIATLAAKAAIAVRAGGKIVLFGNGGSAADAQHIAAELTGRYLRERPPLRALALHTDTSALTAIGNDYGYEHVFERQVQAWVQQGDVAIGLSTSGNSRNVLLALQAARERGAFTAALTGEEGGSCASICHLLLAVPSKATPRIQESHITIAHIFCALLERSLA